MVPSIVNKNKETVVLMKVAQSLDVGRCGARAVCKSSHSQQETFMAGGAGEAARCCISLSRSRRPLFLFVFLGSPKCVTNLQETLSAALLV